MAVAISNEQAMGELARVAGEVINIRGDLARVESMLATFEGKLGVDIQQLRDGTAQTSAAAENLNGRLGELGLRVSGLETDARQLGQEAANKSEIARLEGLIET